MKENKTQTFVFFGIAGSGKGTQIELLEKYLKDNNLASDVLLVYPGSEFRKLTSGDTYTGKLVKERLEGGFLQPDFITISLTSNIMTHGVTEENTLIIDGYPRTIVQAEALLKAMEFYKRKDVKIIYINVDKEEVTKRMQLRGRSDDTVEGIAQRFREYENNVLPAMEYFEGKDGYTIHRINGDQSIEDVHKEIISKLGL